MNQVLIDGNTLALQDVYNVSHLGYGVVLAPAAIERMQYSREVVERIIASGQSVYGVNTGFGKLSTVHIPNEEIDELQLNLVLSHACGVGDAVSDPVVRSAMLLKANSLCKGFSGTRPCVAQALLDLLNNGVVPSIPEKGSVGASGDLAPLAHMTLVLLGMGEAKAGDRLLPGADALLAVHLQPLVLKAKEGLALLNGTQIMTAFAAEALNRALQLVKLADIAGAIVVESLLGTQVAFDERIQKARGFSDQIRVADNLRRMMADSEIVASHKDCGKVQDAYSSRCIPQVHGAVRHGVRFVEEALNTEINACTDNPLVFADDAEILSGGNFHGQPISLACDVLAIAMTQLAGISERRLENLMDANQSGLPPFLAPNSGINSGFMIAQVTAAALVSENKVLSHPASVDSIPTSANQEDFVSMGAHAARKALEVVDNVETVIAIELLAGCQAIDFRRNLKPGRGTAAAYETIRRNVPALEKDRLLQTDIKKLQALIRNGEIVKAVEAAVGPL